MSNKATNPVKELVGRRVEHEFSREKGTITATRHDQHNYSYFVEWDLYPERNDWYNIGHLIVLTPQEKEIE